MSCDVKKDEVEEGGGKWAIGTLPLSHPMIESVALPFPFRVFFPFPCPPFMIVDNLKQEDSSCPSLPQFVQITFSGRVIISLGLKELPWTAKATS